MGKTLYFEDFEVGQSFTSTARTITESDLSLFCMISSDWSAIHADAEFSAKAHHGQRLLHGTFGITFALGKLYELGVFEESAIAMLSVNKWEFKKPIFIGDTLRMKMEIIGSHYGESKRVGRIERRFTVLNQRGETVQIGESDVLVKKHPVADN